MARFHSVLIALIIGLTVIPTSQAQGGWDCTVGVPILYQDSGKFGYLTASGIVIPAQFDGASPFSEGVAVVCKNALCGLIDTTGKYVRPLVDKKSAHFPSGPFSEGLAETGQRNGNDMLYGYVDHDLRVVIRPQFRYAGPFKNGRAKVLLGNKYFFIDKAGKRSSSEYYGAYDFSEGLAGVYDNDGTVSFIRPDGSIAIGPKYRATMSTFSEGLVSVRDGDRIGYIDETGKMVIPPFDKYGAFPFSEGIAVIWDHRSYIDHDHWSYIDKTGKPAFQGQWSIAHPFREGVASVESGGKWSYIDHEGKPAFAGVYDAAMPFCGGVAAVETFVITGPVPNMPCRADMRKGKHGMIDRAGRYIWREPEDHEYAGNFCE